MNLAKMKHWPLAMKLAMKGYESINAAAEGYGLNRGEFYSCIKTGRFRTSVARIIAAKTKLPLRLFIEAGDDK